MKKVIIVGGGAAGLVAAITAAKNGKKAVILEKENKTGKKILVTGNGKCNLTNEEMTSNHYYGDRVFIETVLGKFGTEDTIKFFKQCGVITKKKGSYIYPHSEQAQTIANKLREVALKNGVTIKTNNKVESIIKTEDGFDVDTGFVQHCDEVILATGGSAFPQSGSDHSGCVLAKKLGHTIIEQQPALTGLICENNPLKKAGGVRVNTCIRLFTDESAFISESGELQITDYGISGIPVFNISRLAFPKTKIEIDFLPEYTLEQTQIILKEMIDNDENSELAKILQGLFHEKLANVFIQSISAKQKVKVSDLTDEQICTLVRYIKNYPQTVVSRRGFEYAQVTSGGVSTDEICQDTMESKIVRGLYFAGEIIDVDGICGGYNLQFAWATGAIAGGVRDE